MTSILRGVVVSGAVSLLCALIISARAGEDPKAWRLMVISDLTLPGPQQATLVGIWADQIAANNQRAGRLQMSTQAPKATVLPANVHARAASVVVRSPDVVLQLSLFEAHGACESVGSSSGVLRCPLRLVRFEKGATTIREGRGCFAAGKAGSVDPVAYASYDPATHMIRLGVIARGEAVEGCSQSVPVKESQ